MIERGKYIGDESTSRQKGNAGDLDQCPGCGEWFNPADLGEAFDHAHGPIRVRIKPSELHRYPRRKAIAT
jgi:hypothetical protein